MCEDLCDALFDADGAENPVTRLALEALARFGWQIEPAPAPSKPAENEPILVLV